MAPPVPMGRVWEAHKEPIPTTCALDSSRGLGMTGQRGVSYEEEADMT